MTQHELAQRVARWILSQYGVSTAIDADYLSRLERGVIRWPAEITRRALEAALGATATNLGFVNLRLGGPRKQRRR